VCEQRVIYVCSLSDISVIMCTDTVNVYNRTSGRIKNPTVHHINACESRSRPFTDAETRQACYWSLLEIKLGVSQVNVRKHQLNTGYLITKLPDK